MKSIKNRNKMLFSIANNSGSRRELNNIGAKSSKKHYDPSSESSSDESDSDSSLSSDSYWDTYR